MSKRLTTEEFISKAKQIHSDKYDYSKVEYADAYTKICIICPIHGEFWQVPHNHLCGKGCNKCAHKYVNSLKVQGFEGFKKKVQEKYGERFILKEETYKDSSSKMEIICRKHGTFMITPNNFLRGHKCPRCNDSKLETEVSIFLIKNGIEFIQNANSSIFKWLKNQHLDFYLPKYNIAIECQGGQHFESVEHFEGNVGFLKRRKRDINKKELCNKNNIKLIYYSNLKKYSTFLGENVYHNKNELLKIIKK